MNHELATTVLLSLRISFLAVLLDIPLAAGAAWLLARSEFRGKLILDGIVHLPLVMPPITTGFLLLLILGKNGVIGNLVYSLTGIRIAFTSAAAVIASMVVAFPLITRSLRLSLEMLDRRMESIAATLGASPFEVARRITIPLVLPGLINGLTLGFARSLGEFGATIIFAGNIAGETRTIPLSIFSSLQVPGSESRVVLLILISISISFAAIWVSEVFNRKMKRLSAFRKGAAA